MKQLLLDLALPTPWTLDNFICGQNAEVVHYIGTMVCTLSVETSLYLWGSPGAGKTHVLKATVEATQRQGRSAYYFDCARGTLPSHLATYSLVGIDNVAYLNQSDQIAMFDLYNTFKDNGQQFLAAGDHPPRFLSLRQDLTTRLGGGLVYELKGLSDHDKLMALQVRAQHLGFVLPDELAHYLLHHANRDMATLMQVLAQLDQLALTRHRPVTLPLLREILTPSEGS